MLKLKHYKILKEELLRPDNTGRTPLCLAQADKKRDKWGYVVESDESYKSRADTAKAILEWIQQNDPDILEEVKTW